MRAITLALLSLSPVVAFGQTAPTPGQLHIDEGATSTGGTSVINMGECSGSDELTLQWTVQLDSGTFPPSGSTYKIVASDAAECPPASGSTAKQYVIKEGLAALTTST